MTQLPINPNCYVCETPAGNYRRKVNNVYSIIKCANCGLEYTDPIPTEEKLKLFYSTYEDIRANSDIVELNAKEHLKKLRLIRVFYGSIQNIVVNDII